MSKYSKVSGAKWHSTPNGPKPCTATKKACPYSTHFEIEEDAYDNRNRGVAAKDQNSYNMPFNVVVTLEDDVELQNGSPDIITASNEAMNLREMSDYAKEVYIRTGKKPHLTTGVLTIDLLENKRLVIKREVYGPEESVDARYHLTYWNNANEYQFETVALKNKEEKGSYERLQNVIQQYLEEAHQAEERNIHEKAVKNRLSPEEEEEEKATYSRKLKKAYEQTIATLDQVEILSRGSEKVNDYYAIDLFDNDDPGRLRLTADCSQSIFQPQDVVDSIKIHAMKDQQPKDISIHISENLPNNEGSWALARIPEGNWYFSYAMGKENFTHEISTDDADEAGNVVAEILTEKNMSAKVVESRSNFVKSMVKEVEPAISSYQKTLAMKTPKATTSATAAKEDKSVREKLFGLFS